MPLFTFSDIDQDSQKAIQKAFGLGKTTLLLDGKNTKKLNAADVQEPLVVLGHTQVVHREGMVSSDTKMTLHGMDAKAMAERFAKTFGAKDRSKLQDIYLFACEAGLHDSAESPCFARKFASEMHKKGFVNLQIHAITSPEDARDFVSMRLEITHKAGERAARQVGHCQAFMTTSMYEENAVKLEGLQTKLAGIPKDDIFQTKNRKTLREEISHIEQNQQAMAAQGLIMSTASPKAEFDRPENTFRAQAKVQEILSTPKTFEKEHARVTPQPQAKAPTPKKSRKAKAAPSGHETGRMPQQEPKANLEAVIKFVETLQKEHVQDFIESFARPTRYKHWKAAQTDLAKCAKAALAEDAKTDKRSVAISYIYAVQGACRYLADKPNPERQVELDTHIERALRQLIDLKAFSGVKIPENLGIRIAVAQVETVEEFSNESDALLSNIGTHQRHTSPTPHPRATAHTLGDVDKFYAFKDRVHSSPARSDIYSETGDALKQKILAKFKSKIEQTTDATELHNAVQGILKSDDYKILETGQDRFTRIFGLKTSSVKALESMIEEQKTYLESCKKTL